MKALVVFGSKSDSYIYDDFCSSLKKSGHEYEFDVISAHRNPDELEIALKEKQFDVVIGGAGLSAHLPGVIASKTSKPVFGIPVEAHFGGLDALLSIFQMPFGVPVLSCGPGKSDEIAPFLSSIEKVEKSLFKNINLVVASGLLKYEYVDVELKRTIDFMNSNELSNKIVSEPVKGELNIVLVNEASEIYTDYELHGVCLHTPILDNQKKSTPAVAIDIMHFFQKGGLWVGVNNTRNAVKSFLKFR